jgi:hypothetical protein
MAKSTDRTSDQPIDAFAPSEGADLSDPVDEQDNLTVEEQADQTRIVAEQQRQEAIAKIEEPAPESDADKPAPVEVSFDRSAYPVVESEDIGNEVRFSVAGHEEVTVPVNGTVTVDANHAAALASVPGIVVKDAAEVPQVA